MPQVYDIIIIGVGAMGASTCFHLASGGARVLGLEQFDISHSQGSSTGFSRMIRMAYYEHPDYVPLLRRAYELWHELENLSGQKLLYQTGGLYLGAPDCELITGSLQAAKLHGLPYEMLDRRQLAERFGAFHVPENWSTMLEPAAGFLLPEKVISTFADLAMRRGAEIHGREEVIQWKAVQYGVEVQTTRGRYSAKRLVICGGAWSGKLLASLGLELQVTRQVMGWVWPRQQELFALNSFPVWAIGHADGSLHYGFPMMGHVPGLKIAHHAPGTPTDPDRVERQPLPGDEETFRDALRQFLPAGDGPLLALRTCLYTNSRDHHFIIDEHPQHPNVILACGFSGHGFKFASVIGEILADLAMQRESKLPFKFLSLERLSAG